MADGDCSRVQGCLAHEARASRIAHARHVIVILDKPCSLSVDQLT
jgi:hypothetical protein